MKKFSKTKLTRRNFIKVTAFGTPAFAVAACGSLPSNLQLEPAATQPGNSTVPTKVTSTSAAYPSVTVSSSGFQSTSVPVTQTATSAAATAANTEVPQAATAGTTTIAAAAQTQNITQALALTPSCSSRPSQTLAETEGPYFKPSSPLRNSLLETGTSGTKLVLTGYVLSTDCIPVKNALLDFWQADANGQYDNQNFKMRGHQFTDANGQFRLETVIPGLYPGRTRHIHVKVQAFSQPILTTQLFFPNEPSNQSDSIFHQQLLMEIQDNASAGKDGKFNFVVKVV